MQFREQQLANGLQVIAEVNPKAHSTAIGFFVNTGSRDETDEISGVSHFLEHMVFKGTPKRSAEDVNRELDEIGSQSNAYTSEERTVYYATVLPEYQGRTVELLSDIMRPSLREDDFEMEKQVILEEIAKYEDQPPFGASEKAMAAHFGDHPMGHSILGTVESVAALTPQQMRGYFEKRYSPGNITLAAAGRIDFDALVADAESHCGTWQPFDVSRDARRAVGQHGFEVICKPSAAQEYIVQLANGPAADDDDRYAGRLLATILGDDSGSRMYWDLVDPGLAEYAAIGPYEFEGTGAFITFLGCMPESAEENLQRILDIQRVAERDGVTEEELTRAKAKVCSHVVLSGELATRRLFAVGTNWLQRHEYRTLREVSDSYRNVTLDEVAAVLAKYPLTTNTTVAIGPLPELARPS